MRRCLFLLVLAGLGFSYSAHGGTCRPVYNMNNARGGLPANWGGYRRYNKCCLSQSTYIDLQLGGYRLDAPGFEFGEVLGGGAEGIGPIPEFFTPHDRLTSFYPHLAVGVDMINCWTPCWVGNSIFFEVGGSYISNDLFHPLGNGTFPAVAIPDIDGCGDFIPVSSVQTVFSGVDFKRKYRYGNVAFKLGSSFLAPASCRFSFVPYLELDFNYLHQGYLAKICRITRGTAGTVATDFFLDEGLDTKYYDFGVGLSAGWAFSTGCRTPFIFADATVFASASHTVFHGRESATILTVPEFIDLVSKHDDFRAKYRLQFGAGYQFGYNFSVALMGQFDRWGYIPQLINPHRIGTTSSGTGLYDRPAHIVRRTANNYAAVLRLNFIFF